MQYRRITLLIGLAQLIMSSAVVAGARDGQQRNAGRNTESIWESEARPRQSPPWYDWLLDEETVSRIMKGLQQRNPEKATELQKLQKENPEQFKAELAIYGNQEIQEISRERSDAWRRKQLEDFVAWLKTNYPKEEEALTKTKETDPQLYTKSVERIRDQYGPIYEAERTNPELAGVLKEDLRLKQRRNELLWQFRRERSDQKRREMGAELYGIVARRYDLIVRRKQIAYDQLQTKLQELQQLLDTSKEDIVRWQDPNVRGPNIRGRMENLVGRQRHFPWDD